MPIATFGDAQLLRILDATVSAYIFYLKYSTAELEYWATKFNLRHQRHSVDIDLISRNFDSQSSCYSEYIKLANVENL